MVSMPRSSMWSSAACSAGRLPWMSVRTATGPACWVTELRARRHVGADDRRGRVLVDAVGLGDLDLGEAGGRESLLELLARQRTGDAAGPRGHVGLGGRVHVAVGHDVGDGEAT